VKRGWYFLTALIVGLVLSACATDGDDVTPRSEAERARAAETQVSLGVGYLEKGRNELALERFQKALEFNPKAASAHTSMGVLYEGIQRNDLAEKSYKRAAELEPKKGGVHNNYGQFLCRIGRFDEADKEFIQALDDPFYATPAVAATNAGKCARAAGKVEAAERYLRMALQRDPNAVEVYLPLAGLLQARGQSMNARAFLQRHEASGLPQNAEYLKLAVAVETKLGDVKAAAAFRDRLENEFPNAEQARGTEKSNEQPHLLERAQ
jgi:type IV pilus assembly protein PilF